MSNPLFPIIALTVWSLGAAALTTPARADSLSCQSVNGETRCVGSGGLDCRSVEGRMTCTPGAQGACESVHGMIVCRNGNVTQSFRAAPIPRWHRVERTNDEDTSESPSKGGFPQLTD